MKYIAWLWRNSRGIRWYSLVRIVLKDEYLIPEVVSELVQKGKASLKLISTPDVWFGVTYKEDKDFVVSSLKKLVEKGLYKKGLY